MKAFLWSDKANIDELLINNLPAVFNSYEKNIRTKKKQSITSRFSNGIVSYSNQRAVSKILFFEIVASSLLTEMRSAAVKPDLIYQPTGWALI